MSPHFLHKNHRPKRHFLVNEIASSPFLLFAPPFETFKSSTGSSTIDLIIAFQPVDILPDLSNALDCFPSHHCPLHITSFRQPPIKKATRWHHFSDLLQPLPPYNPFVPLLSHSEIDTALNQWSNNIKFAIDTASYTPKHGFKPKPWWTPLLTILKRRTLEAKFTNDPDYLIMQTEFKREIRNSKKRLLRKEFEKMNQNEIFHHIKKKSFSSPPSGTFEYYFPPEPPGHTPVLPAHHNNLAYNYHDLPFLTPPRCFSPYQKTETI